MANTKSASNRIASLDQFRGYTVAGMFLVNFVNVFPVSPLLLTHKNTFFSYADTIMPQFFFAVGFAFRLTFGRRLQTEGLASAYAHVVRRMLGLALVALVVYHVSDAARNWQELVQKGPWEVLSLSAKHTWFQTLMHIAATTIWILPVIRSSPLVRVAYLIFSAILQVLVSYWFYFEWVHTGCVDGGPLGFLGWAIPTITGTLACDAVITADGRPRLAKMFAWSVVLMALGYLLSCGTTLYDVPENQIASLQSQVRPEDAVFPSRERWETHQLGWAEPPFVLPPDSNHRKENYWMMSQRAATVSYHMFGAGFSLIVYWLFYWACDVGSWQLGLFRTFGTNALAGYVLHMMIADSVRAFMPKDSPGWYVAAGFFLFFGLVYLFIRHLEKHKIYLKL